MRQRYDFEFVDGVATADAAFKAAGKDLAEIMSAGAAALFSAIIDLDEIDTSVTREVSVAAADEETLLFDWLSELVYLKDVHRELYSEFHVTVDVAEDGFRLTAKIRGEPIDSDKHLTNVDVKAVTYHRLKVEKTTSGYESFVVLDL